MLGRPCTATNTLKGSQVENKRVLWGVVAFALICATLMSFLPPDTWRFGWRIINGDRISWNANSLVVNDRDSVWVITKSGQLQLNLKSDVRADIYLEYMDGPSRMMQLLVDDSCAMDACETATKFKRQMGVHQAECVRITYAPSSGRDYMSIICAVENASILAQYIGPPGLAEVARRELESLTSQITVIRAPSRTRKGLPN